MTAGFGKIDETVSTGEADSVAKSLVTTLEVVNLLPHGVGDVPLTCGVNFPRGAFFKEGFGLRSRDGQETAVQATPLARWSDSSLKWVLFDWVAPILAAGTTPLAIVAADQNEKADASAAPTVTVQRGQIDVTSGTLKCSLSCVLHSVQGAELCPAFGAPVWESRGPARHTACLSGRFARHTGLQCQLRLHMFPQTGQIKAEVRLHNTRRAAHPGGQWDLGDRNSVRFDGLDLIVRPECDAAQIRWQAESGKLEQSLDTGVLSIYQDSSGCENWSSRNHVNALGRVPCRFRGYRLEAPGRTEHGDHASPIVALDGDHGSLFVGVPEFWQQFPSSITATPESVRVGLFPREWDDLFELQGGEQKTLAVWIGLGDLTQELSNFDWINQPPRLRLAPEWHQHTSTFPYFVGPLADPHRRAQDALRGAVQGDASLLARREVTDEFGWRHFGEVWADHEQACCSDSEPVISHYNNQFDVVYGAILQYARTGDVAWCDLFCPLARHVIDIDLYHTTQDRAAYNGGLFWHTDHYVSAGTCTHRTYSAKNARRGQDYGGGPSDEHNYTTGLLYYYFMTGNPDARASVISLADWVINVDDGRQTVFGLIDSRPTGLASATAFPDYHGPGRGAGNSVNALLDAWQLTWDGKYLAYAEALIRRVVHPEEEIDRLDLLNVEVRWSYTVFLSALGKYLDLKSEAGIRDEMWQYAAASLTHYGRWMLHNELPYFDQREKLEYPTETWAAQDLRKANVLRLAAKFCQGDEQDSMRRRGDELADRAWDDLDSFESRGVARALTLAMTEGVKDCWLRTNFPDATEIEKRAFALRVPFVGQKERVKAQLKSPGGILRALVHALRPTLWGPFLRNLWRRR